MARRPDDRDSDLDRELQSHLDLETEDRRSDGLSAEDARSAAHRALGNTGAIRENVRDTWRWIRLEGVRNDIRYGARVLRRNPGFTATVVLTLAMGIGANSAIFSVCDAVLLKPLPYPEPDRVVMLWEQAPRATTLAPVAPANYFDWRDESRSLAEVAAINPYPTFVLTGGSEPARLAGAAVSSNFFHLLGTRIALGRDFLPEEDHPGRDRVAILTYGLWTDRLGGRTDIAGKTITLNDLPYTVVGILPREFEFVSKASDFQARNRFDVWVPLALTDRERGQRNTHPLRVFARLGPGATLEQAQAELNSIASNLSRLYPEWNKDWSIVAVPVIKQVTAEVRGALVALLGAVALVLLLACASVANLLLARAAARQREMTLRVALGAGRVRLAQQLLTESVLLATIGGAAGLLLAFTATRLLIPLLPIDLPRAADIAIDGRVLIFTGLTSVATGLLFGLLPIFQVDRANAGESLKQSIRIAGGGQAGTRATLVVAQIAIAVVLLIGGGLMVRSLSALLQVAPGFRTEHIVTARLSLSASRYENARRIAPFHRELLARVRSSPGTQSAGLTAYPPLSGTDNAWGFDIEGRTLPTGEHNLAKYRPVSAGYFEAIGIPLLRGRDFNSADDEDSPPAVVVNESMARQFWGGADPVGQRIRFGTPAWRTVVGIVGDVRHDGLGVDMKSELYVPFSQAPNNEARTTIVVRTAIAPAATIAALRQTVAAIDTTIPIDQVATMEDVVSASLGEPRFRAVLLGVFSILALVIATVGIYGVMNSLVLQRTQEFGVRLAIGATAGSVLRLVLGRAAMLIAAGVVLGLVASAGLARLVTTLLFGVSALDATTYASVSALLAIVALVASYVPARRATRIDPIRALRQE